MKKKYLISILAMTCITFRVAGADPKYPVSTIPEHLATHVNAVFREDHLTFKIHSRSKASYVVRQVITIMNPKGKHYATEIVGYNKLSKIKDINGTVYDAFGKQIKRLKTSEIYDQSAYDGFSLYSDSRFKMIDLTQGSYPYTVEFEYEVELKYLFYIPGFELISEEGVSIENSSYSLHYPADLAPRVKTFNTEVKPLTATTTEGLMSLIWKFNNIPSIAFEPHSLRKNFITRITAAPSQFEYDNYSGTMNSWDEFGKWILSLNKGRNNLPEASKKKIHELTKQYTTTEDKVRAVYQYLQSRTRYVSIQLGIGGYQPFEAALVDETGYGDCKALSNYTVAMLETIGIKAHYVLIQAGEEHVDLDVDFPSPQFNHAIVAVPNGADTIWLECTSQTNPFGYQGSFTGDRKALAITETGARVVNTIRYTAEQNLRSRSAEVRVDLSGDATASILSTYSGLQYENGDLHTRLSNQYDEQKKWIHNNTNIPTFDIVSFSMSDKKEKVPSAEVKLDLNLKRYASVSGKRIFFTPNLMSRSTYIPPRMDNRKTNVIRKVAYLDVDTIRYQLPEGVYPEFVPAPLNVTNRFGEYQINYKLEEGSLIYTRRLKMNKGEFSPESYSELVEFFKTINKADNTKLVFMSKT